MISLENITAGYKGVEILKNINISFEEGKITSIIGKNGCGKSTLLKVSSSLLKPFCGEVFINNTSISIITKKDIAKRISYLPQSRTVPNITVYNLVMHGRFPYLGFSRTPQKKDKLIVEDAIEKMGLLEYRNKNIQELSGGQRQKVYMAMVLAQDTDVIFLDEPTTYLDINHQFEILEIVKELKNMGKTIVMVLHDLSSALSYSDKVCLMEKGEIVTYDSPEAVFHSEKIQKVFSVDCEEVCIKDGVSKQYIFYSKDY